jgi:hypothetical protein
MFSDKISINWYLASRVAVERKSNIAEGRVVGILQRRGWGDTPGDPVAGLAYSDRDSLQDRHGLKKYMGQYVCKRRKVLYNKLRYIDKLTKLSINGTFNKYIMQNYLNILGNQRAILF